MQEDLEQREQKELEKKEKAEKSTKRKSLAGAGAEDVDMEDAGDDAAPKKAKATKKRKKGDESDGENEKVCSRTIAYCTKTNQLTACKDSQDEAQADHQDSQRCICSEAQEGAKVQEEGKRGSGAGTARGATYD